MKPEALAILGIDRLIYNKGLDPRGVISLGCSKINLFGFARMSVQTCVGQGFGLQPLSLQLNVPVKFSSKLHFLPGLSTAREKQS